MWDVCMHNVWIQLFTLAVTWICYWNTGIWIYEEVFRGHFNNLGYNFSYQVGTERESSPFSQRSLCQTTLSAERQRLWTCQPVRCGRCDIRSPQPSGFDEFACVCCAEVHKNQLWVNKMKGVALSQRDICILCENTNSQSAVHKIVTSVTKSHMNKLNK